MSDGGGPAKHPSRASVRFTAPIEERVARPVADARAASSPPLDFDDATSPGHRLSALVSIPSDAPMPAPSPAAGEVPGATTTSSALPAHGEITGAMLKRVREEKGFSLDELSEHTKIRKQHLVAIESQDLASLPARVYLRGFLTQIARVLRVDKHRLADGYLTHVDLVSK